MSASAKSEYHEDLINKVGGKQKRKVVPLWTVPVPFNESPRPAMNPEYIPEPIRSLAQSAATATQTSLDMTTMAILPVISSTIARKLVVRASDSWVEPTPLWMMSIAEPGRRKSAVVRIAQEPLQAIEIVERERLATVIKKRESDRRIAEKALSQIERKLANVAPGSDAELGLQFDQKTYIERLDRLEEIHPPVLYLNDVTTERMTIAMRNNGGSIAIISAEGGIIENIAGIYSNGEPRVDQYLQAHAGDPIRVERINRPPVYIERPALTIALLAQPDVALAIGRNPRLIARGFPQRFLFGQPELPPKANEDLDPPRIPDDQRDAYGALVQFLYQHRPPGDPSEIRLSTEAKSLLDSFRRKINLQMDTGGELADCKEWAAKLAGATIRVAAAFHAAIHGAREQKPEQYPIHEETMSSAILLSYDYFIPHALAVFGLMGTNPRAALAKRIVALIQREQQDIWTKRDIHHRLGSGLTTEEIVPAIDYLEDLGYIRLLVEETPQRRTGPRSIRFEVNPHVTKGGKPDEG